MKKLFIAILSVFYLVSSFGASIDMHYCMGKLIDTSFSYIASSDNTKCSNCGMIKSSHDKKNCCKDEHKRVKTTDDQRVVSQVFFISPNLFFSEHLVYPGFIVMGIPSSSGKTTSGVSPPPLVQPTPVYLMNRVFRI